MIGFAKLFLEDENGATAIEYGLIAALISIVIVTAATAVFTNIAGKFNKISNALTTS